MVNNLPAVQETQVQSLGWEDPLEVSESEVTLSRLTLRDPMDCSLPGSSIHGIFQTRVLEWGAIAFSDFRLEDYLLSQSFNHEVFAELSLKAQLLC